MAEEQKPSDGNDFGPLEVLIGIVILFFLFSFLFSGIKNTLGTAKPGTVLGDVKVLVQKVTGIFKEINTVTLGSKLGVNTEIRNSYPSILYGEPGGSPIKGIPEGAEGVIVGGPVQYNGTTWWKVEYADGSVGFVPEDTLSPVSAPNQNETPQEEATGPLSEIYLTFQIVSAILSFILLVGVGYCLMRVIQIQNGEYERLHRDGSFFGEASGYHEHEEGEVSGIRGREKWEVIEKHLVSDAENDWRLAILEADILLDELVRSLGYQGENLGERLKSIDKSDFQTLDKAWEAHKIRNTIAHEGINFVVSQREAKRVIGLFEEVFKEFNYI